MPTAARSALDADVTFALYGATSRMIAMHRPLLAPLGLTFPQYLVLVQLFAESPRTVGALGESAGMDTGTITPRSSTVSCSAVARCHVAARWPHA